MKTLTKSKCQKRAIVLKKQTTKQTPQPVKQSSTQTLASMMSSMKVDPSPEPFKFNFNLNQDSMKTKDDDTQSKSASNATNFKFVKSDNSFRFNFDNT